MIWRVVLFCYDYCYVQKKKYNTQGLRLMIPTVVDRDGGSIAHALMITDQQVLVHDDRDKVDNMNIYYIILVLYMLQNVLN